MAKKDARHSLSRHSIGEAIISSSSVSSIANEEPLPHYMRASVGSCHDMCKYGRKHDFESESKHPFLQKSSNMRKKSPRVDKLNLAEGRKMPKIKLNSSSSHAKNDVPGKLAFDRQVPSASDTKETQAKVPNLGDQKKKQAFKTRTVVKSIAFSNKHKVEVHPSPSPVKGIDAAQRSVIIKKNTPLQEATSSAKFSKKTSLKNCTPEDPLPNPKHRSSVPEEMNKVDAKYVASRRVNKTLALAPGSPLVSLRESFGDRKSKEKIINIREITITPENKMPKPSTASASLELRVNDSISSLKQRKHKDGDEATPIKDQMVEISENDTEKNEDITLKVLDEIAGIADTDSAEQKSLEMDKVLSAEQLLIKWDIDNLDSLRESLKLENADMGIPEKSINLDSHDLNPDGQNLLQVKHDNTILLDQNVLKLNPEKVDVDSLDLRPNGLKFLEPENDINSQEKNLPKLEHLDFVSHELEPTNLNLLGLQNGKTEVLEQKLLKQEDSDLDLLEQKLPEHGNVAMNSLEQKLPELEGVDLDSLALEHNNQELLEQEDADMNSFEQKLLEPEGMSLDSLVMKHSDQKLLEQGDADMKSLEQKLLEPEGMGLDSLVLKHCDQKLPEQENAKMNSLEKKLPKSQDMDLDSLELKHTDPKLPEQENVDMNSLEQKLLKPVNIDLDSPDHHQLYELATDEEVEIEESESSSEAAESENEYEVKEVDGDYEPSKTGERRRARGNYFVHPEDKTPGPHKLKFRRGRTIELQTESNGPRRLRFRRRRIVEVGADGMNTVRKNFLKSEMTEAAPDSTPEAQSIVLKHQGAQEKKDAKGLFNNVIEETASKLVETRKSKVKALVGAFETVISLQDSKQESTT